MLMTREKSFYKTFFVLFLPLVCQDVINLGVNVADNVMLGAYSQNALAGATAVNQIQFILQCLVGGLGSGITVLGSQYWGQQRTQPIKQITAFAFRIAMVMAILVFATCATCPDWVLSLFTDNTPAAKEGIEYLDVLKYSYPLFAVTTILVSALNSVETVQVSFWVSVETLITNIALNALLIPRMGSRGAAIATMLARVGALILVLIYVLFADRKLRLRPADMLKTDRLLNRDYIKAAYPIVIVSGMWGCSNAIQTSILGHMADAALPASSASYSLYSLFKAASQAACNACGIIMAKTVGSGDLKKVKEYTKTFQIMFIVIGILSAGLLYLAKGPVYSYYKLDDEAMRLAEQFILVMCVCTVGMGYQMPTISGIIRGGGDTRFCFINDLITIWGVVLPVSYLAAFVWNWLPVAVVACLNSDQIIKCGAAAVRCNRYKWVKNLTREEIA